MRVSKRSRLRLHYHRHHHCIRAASATAPTIYYVCRDTWLLAAASACIFSHWLRNFLDETRAHLIGVHFRVAFLRRTCNMKLHFLAEKIWTVFFDYYLDYLATDLLQKTLNESKQQLKPTKGLGRQLEDARRNATKTRLQLNLVGWKTTFSFRSHTLMSEMWLRFAVFSNVWRIADAKAKFHCSHRTIGPSQTAHVHVHPLVRLRSILSSEKSNRNVKDYFCWLPIKCARAANSLYCVCRLHSSILRPIR